MESECRQVLNTKFRVYSQYSVPYFMLQSFAFNPQSPETVQRYLCTCPHSPHSRITGPAVHSLCCPPTPPPCYHKIKRNFLWLPYVLEDAANRSKFNTFPTAKSSYRGLPGYNAAWSCSSIYRVLSTTDNNFRAL